MSETRCVKRYEIGEGSPKSQMFEKGERMKEVKYPVTAIVKLQRQKVGIWMRVLRSAASISSQCAPASTQSEAQREEREERESVAGEGAVGVNEPGLSLQMWTDTPPQN